MFIVFNKEKIKSYLVSVGTVAFLFVMAFIIKDKQTYETSARINQVQEIITNSVNMNIIQNVVNE